MNVPEELTDKLQAARGLLQKTGKELLELTMRTEEQVGFSEVDMEQARQLHAADSNKGQLTDTLERSVLGGLYTPVSMVKRYLPVPSVDPLSVVLKSRVSTLGRVLAATSLRGDLALNTIKSPQADTKHYAQLIVYENAALLSLLTLAASKKGVKSGVADLLVLGLVCLKMSHELRVLSGQGFAQKGADKQVVNMLVAAPSEYLAQKVAVSFSAGAAQQAVEDQNWSKLKQALQGESVTSVLDVLSEESGALEQSLGGLATKLGSFGLKGFNVFLSLKVFKDAATTALENYFEPDAKILLSSKEASKSDSAEE